MICILIKAYFVHRTETTKLVATLKNEVDKENGSNLYQLMSTYTLNIITGDMKFLYSS
jgi:hypothetical protein